MCECSNDVGKLSELIETTKWRKGLNNMFDFYILDASSKFVAICFGGKMY